MRNHPLIRGVVITLTSFLLVLILLLVGLTALGAHSEAELSASLKTSVMRAMLTCYAIEGRYPSNVSYLENYYGLTYNHSHYIVSLNAFADNILPDISVLKIGEEPLR